MTSPDPLIFCDMANNEKHRAPVDLGSQTTLMKFVSDCSVTFTSKKSDYFDTLVYHKKHMPQTRKLECKLSLTNLHMTRKTSLLLINKQSMSCLEEGLV